MFIGIFQGWYGNTYVQKKPLDQQPTCTWQTFIKKKLFEMAKIKVDSFCD